MRLVSYPARVSHASGCQLGRRPESRRQDQFDQVAGNPRPSRLSRPRLACRRQARRRPQHFVSAVEGLPTCSYLCCNAGLLYHSGLATARISAGLLGDWRTGGSTWCSENTRMEMTRGSHWLAEGGRITCSLR
ncbi:hypothetical protein OE88DRAFT_501536 [Heliocybe sulcata]|uniref:Uncharacterized protein n=1 Tax=Heliocybe sulcata TaxID=5364 RepID=A0A5C3MTR6_9AGAM|nr:hypothetical protein OE88DRAFT_501536 [Heliocybe sulcata]